jgi:hypothetical protein
MLFLRQLETFFLMSEFQNDVEKIINL